MRRTIRASSILLVAVVLSFAGTAAQDAATGRAFTPEDWYRLHTLSSPAVSPDGRWVAFTVTTVAEADNRRHSEVWMAATEGGEPTRLTSPGSESSNPRWSHDGSYLFFTSRRQGGEGNTWALRMDRSPSGEAFQVKDQPEGSVPTRGAFAVWTEDSSDDDDTPEDESGREDPFRRMAPMARPPFGSLTTPVDPARFDGRHIVDFPYKRNGPGFSPNRREAREWNPTQIWRQAFGDTAKTRITDTRYSHRGAVVSPDGRWIAFTADPDLRPDSAVTAERDSIARLPYDAARDEAPRNDADIFVIPVDGGTPRRVTTMDGSEGRLVWSPDSRQIAFVSSLARTSSNRLWVVDAQGGEPRNVLGDWQYEPQGVDWAANGRLLMSASVGGRTALFHVDPRRGGVEEVVSGRRRINGFSYDRAYRTVAFVATSVDHPTELYVADVDGGNERRLTGFNDALNAEIAWPSAERFTYESVGGLEIEAWLQFPYGYDPGKKYPLVLYIHGGPHSAYGEGWFDEFHNLTGAGMFVLYTNPRGSSGYGADFTYSTRGRWGMEDYEDLMKAVDIAIQRPDVDAERLGVTGGSYGGFMTAWITGHTDRFKAAQADRMISNWFSWYGTSDAQGLTEFEFYGKPWDNPDLYWELSPIRYVENVRTPTLIVQSEEDHRTPMTDAEQWFIALRKQGVPTEFLRYPRSTHDLSRTGEPWLLVDRLGRLRQWFTHWLMEEETASGPSN
ncbi:MAG: S9 family peptidase [Gemmatimonadota bacterium]|nr:S9 family peptidase [Gemmatimonadota bacterium]